MGRQEAEEERCLRRGKGVVVIRGRESHFQINGVAFPTI